MLDVIAYIIASNDLSQFLEESIYSLASSMEGLKYKIVVIGNNPNDQIQRTVHRNECVNDHHFTPHSMGVNQIIEKYIPDELESDFILFSDQDLIYQKDISRGTQALEKYDNIGAISFVHSLEHPGINTDDEVPEGFILKNHERSSSILIKSSYFQSLRPFPKDALDFDWWIMSHSENSLFKNNLKVAVLPYSTIRLGWKKGTSILKNLDLPERAENKKRYIYKKHNF
jgi:hypothetical protein